MADTLVRYKGLSDIVLAGITIFQPGLIYHSAYSVWVNSVTGYKIADPFEGAGFVQGCGFLLGVIGIAQVVGSFSGPGARPTLFAINASTAAFAVLSSIFQKEKGLACTMTLTTAVTQTLVTVLLYLLGGTQGAGTVVDKGKKRA